MAKDKSKSKPFKSQLSYGGCVENLGYYPSAILASEGAALPTAHCPLPTAHCPLPTAHCLLPTAHCPLPTAHCPLPTAHCLHHGLQCATRANMPLPRPHSPQAAFVYNKRAREVNVEEGLSSEEGRPMKQLNKIGPPHWERAYKGVKNDEPIPGYHGVYKVDGGRFAAKTVVNCEVFFSFFFSFQ